MQSVEFVTWGCMYRQSLGRGDPVEQQAAGAASTERHRRPPCQSEQPGTGQVIPEPSGSSAQASVRPQRTPPRSREPGLEDGCRGPFQTTVEHVQNVGEQLLSTAGAGRLESNRYNPLDDLPWSIRKSLGTHEEPGPQKDSCEGSRAVRNSCTGAR